jgi:16S rRNA (cytidine1402-2'-O)-methyltransferase
MSTLFVVATPIGNLADASFRCIETLKVVHVVYAEDTRRSRVFLDHYGIQKPLRSLHEHNERAKAQDVVNALGEGDVALLTDAGTPAVSDPGAELVAFVAADGAHKVVPIPGPSALAAALSVAGFDAASMTFLGFLPVKGSERAELLAAIANNSGIVVLYEAPHRIGETLSQLAAQEPERLGCLCREITKVHEETARGALKELAARFSGEVRGEITLVLGPVQAVASTLETRDLDAAIKRALDAGLSARDAATAVAAVLELPKREVYQRVQSLTKGQ